MTKNNIMGMSHAMYFVGFGESPIRIDFANMIDSIDDFRSVTIITIS